MSSLEVLISTLGADGIERVAAMGLPEADGVSYLVSWQRSDGCDVPDPLKSRADVRIIRNPGIGLSQNRNYALDHAEADILLIADDDLTYSAGSLRQVRRIFEEEPDIDIALFRYSNERGSYEKNYPSGRTEIGSKLPKGYYTTSFEIALRREGRSGSLRFCEAVGLGAPVLKCGEEELFLLDARRRGHKVVFFPLDLCIHNGPTTGMRRITDPGVYRGMGAVTALLYPLTFLPRYLLMAMRGAHRGQMAFFPAVWNFIYGAAYMVLSVRPFRRRERK